MATMSAATEIANTGSDISTPWDLIFPAASIT